MGPDVCEAAPLGVPQDQPLALVAIHGVLRLAGSRVNESGLKKMNEREWGKFVVGRKKKKTFSIHVC